MTKNRSVKKRLLFALLSITLCIAMLLGTTYAWFTDTVTSGRNIIKAGNLDVELSYSYDRVDWKPVKDSTEIFDANAEWEPGYTQLVYFKVENLGTLALKYKLSARIYEETLGKTEGGDDIKLSDFLAAGEIVLDGTVTDIDRDTAVQYATDKFSDGINSEAVELLKGETHELAYVIAMPESVGNEANFRGDVAPSIDFGIELFATQLAAEEDGFGPDYDADAMVTDAQGFVSAIEAGKDVKLEADVTLGADTLDIVGDITINLNGYDLDASASTSRPFNMTDGSTLTIVGANETVTMGKYGLINVSSDADATIDLKGGNYVGNTDNGAFIKLRASDASVSINMDCVTVTDSSDDGYIINAYDFENGVATFNIKNSNLTAASGLQLVGDFTLENVTVNATGGTLTNVAAVEGAYGQGVIKNCTINVTNANNLPLYVGVGAGNNSDIEIINTEINGCDAQYRTFIYSTGGTITEPVYTAAGSAAEVENALSAAGGDPVYIQITNDVDLSTVDLTTVTGDVTINAGGAKLTTTANRAIQLAAGGNVTVEEAVIEITHSAGSTSDARGVAISEGDYTGKTVTLKDCVINMNNSDWAYGVNLVGGTKNLNLVIEGCTIDGAIAINVWGDNNTITITDSTLICSYKTNAMYGSAVVKLNDDGTNVAENNKIVIDGCKFEYTGENNYNMQIIGVHILGENNTVTVTNSTYGAGITMESSNQ